MKLKLWITSIALLVTLIWAAANPAHVAPVLIDTASALIARTEPQGHRGLPATMRVEQESYERLMSGLHPAEKESFLEHWAAVSLETCRPLHGRLYQDLDAEYRATYLNEYATRCLDESGKPLGPLPRTSNTGDSQYLPS